MDLEFTEDQQELRSSVRAVLERESSIGFVREIVEKGASAERLWTQMVELGWPAVTIPETAGGLGQGFVELTVVVEELGRVVAPGPFLPTVTQFAPLVREAGDAEQQARFLGAIAEGTSGTVAIAEQAHGLWSPDSAMGTTARRNGEGWVLSGAKRYVMGAPDVDEVAVVASVDGGGTGVFVVPTSDVDVTPVDAFDATRPLGTLAFDGTHVPADRALSPGNAGDAVTRAVEEATVSLAVETVGTCQTIFDITLDYAKAREQFGVPIGSFQAIKHKMADMFVSLEKARATAYFAALTIAEDDSRRALATSMAKAAAGDCQRLLAQEGIQIHGGIGYTWEADVHLYVKRAKTGDALFGTAAEHRARVADLIGL